MRYEITIHRTITYEIEEESREKAYRNAKKYTGQRKVEEAIAIKEKK